MTAYCREIELRLTENPEWQTNPIDSIFLGGGTPSYASASFWQSLLRFLRHHFNITQDSEISMELNPEDVHAEYLEKIKAIGINRINVGIQSFQKRHLQTLNRFFDDRQYSKIINLITKYYSNSSGIDLIYGIPGQTYEDFRQDLDIACSGGLTHLSIYSLTVEQGTAYANDTQKGISKKPDESLQIKILQELPALLQPYEFCQYEVSNYCRQNKVSRHNLKYWTMQSYLGIGPAAHGFTKKGRYANPRSIKSYLKNHFNSEYLPSDYWDELSLSLFRLFWPIQLNEFIKLPGEKKQPFIDLLLSFQQQGLCHWDGEIFQWQPQAILYLDDLILKIASI